MEILSLCDQISMAPNIAVLNNLYQRYGDYDSPQIAYQFGISYLMQNNMASAKKCLIKGALYGINYPCSTYNHTFVDSIGQCFAFLVTQYPVNFYVSGDTALKATILAYIYLSRSIELNPRESQDSYRTRGILFKDHECPPIVQKILLENLGMNILKEPFIISDYYFASQAKDSPFRDCLTSAQIMQNNLGTTSIGGKAAYQYSLLEIAEFGEKRHSILYKLLETKYKQGVFNMSKEELVNINATF